MCIKQANKQGRPTAKTVLRRYDCLFVKSIYKKAVSYAARKTRHRFPVPGPIPKTYKPNET